MLFNSFVFAFIFLPLVITGYFQLCRRASHGVGKAWLVLASFFFYGWWNPAYLPLILGSIAVNFLLGRRIAALAGDAAATSGARRALLVLGVAFNLGLLGFFKYADFFSGNVNALLGPMLPLLHLALPLAISFFTFQQIAFLVDASRGQVRELELLDYALFVSFFPQLIAGPIVHHRGMMPQFQAAANRAARYDNLAAGLYLFAIGMAKKVVIADTLSVWVNAGYGADVPLSMADAWITSLAYTLQLYFDFSGYTDMATGAARMLNIELPQNFDSPYKARSIQEFWRRWHMTLSSFLRDYLYIPLGGNRRGEGRTFWNLFVTFLLGGLWHGAGWTFVVWGALHGLGNAINRLWRERVGIRLPGPLAWLLTSLFVHVAWVFFRAPDFASALHVLSGMAGLNGALGLSALAGKLSSLSWLIAIVSVPLVLLAPNSIELARRFTPTRGRLVFCVLLLTLDLLYLNSAIPSEFLYFDF